VSEDAVGAAKVVAHWLTFGPLLLVAALPSSFILGIAPETLGRTMLALAAGTPGLAALAVMVAALTAGLPRAGALAGVLLLPLAVPLLIFGAGASGDSGSGALLLEAAISLLLVAAAPFVTGAAIRAART
jgi:heme exporter protein B